MKNTQDTPRFLPILFAIALSTAFVVTSSGKDDGAEVAFFTLSGVNQSSPIVKTDQIGTIDDDTAQTLNLTPVEDISLVASDQFDRLRSR